ncbi:MAG: glycosyltransferase family 4 protein [Deltaproteobacteria bacterium]|nr:glycosyltransferase family 4 protein [Deltaproteobacteria bacterium]
MRIGLLTTSYPRHPHDLAGRFVAELAGWFAERGDALEVLAPEPARSDHPRVQVHALHYARRPLLFYGAGAPDNLLAGGLTSLDRLRRFAQVPGFVAALAAETHRRSARWDALLSHWLVPPGLVGALAARGLPHLAIGHGTDVELLARLPGAWSALHALARPRTALVLTHEAQRALLAARTRTPRARRLVAEATVVRMGVTLRPRGVTGAERREARARLGLDPGPVALFVGRLVPVKGARVLLEACAELPELTLLVVGEGPERLALGRQAEALGGRVRLVGEKVGPEKELYVRAADLLVVPSLILPDGRTDAAPVVLLEGMAAGLPVLATRVGGAAELVRHGENGWLVRPGEPRALAEALRLLLTDQALRRRLAAAGLATAQEHSWERVGATLRERLNRLVAGG